MDVIFFRVVEGKKYTDYNKNIVAWQRGPSIGLGTALMNRYPKPGDNIKEVKYFAVKDYEKVLFYNKGQLVGVLSGGVYELDKKARIKGTELVWIDTSLITIPWGIPQTNGIPTKDGHVIGLHGDLKLKISDVKVFYNDIVAGKTEWIQENLRLWIMSLLHTSLRDIFKNYNAKSIILEDRERVNNLILSKMIEEFLRYGLELETFNILGIKTSEGTQELFEGEKQKTKLSNEGLIGNLENLVKEKEELQERIKNLRNKINEQQDILLDDKISQEEYEKKKSQIQNFIKEAEEVLKTIDQKLNTN